MQKESVRRHFSDSEVRRFFATAPRAYASKSFDVLALPLIYIQPRLLVVTPKRIGTAPQRNRIRRQLKEIFRINPSYTSLPFDLLLIIKPYALKKTYVQLQEKFQEAIAATTERYTSGKLVPRTRKK